MHHQEGGVWVSYRRWDQRADGSPRGAWRYHRAAALWQYYDEVQREWRDNDLAVRTAAEDPATAVIWCDGVSGDIGALSGDGFVPSSAVADGALFMRYKSDEETIHDGGIPFIPRSRRARRRGAISGAKKAPSIHRPTVPGGVAKADAFRHRSPNRRRRPAASEKRTRRRRPMPTTMPSLPTTPRPRSPWRGTRPAP
ncbi:hypothetical protein [Desulfosarcina cetonica]|uniref:hypothetical protein n=1 Tax=Desulfosarcina cetonica TaxID=90730 RepID=UPI0012ED12A3|nr:hypothetical protein [Desulfosarcina cetonica]